MGTREEQFRRRLLATFQVEAEDYIKGILSGLSAVEAALDSDPLKAAALIEPIFRQFHSLKGASQAIGFDNVGRICQSAENILSAWKKVPAKANKTELSSMIEAALSAASELKIDLASSATVPVAAPPSIGPENSSNRVLNDGSFTSNYKGSADSPESSLSDLKQIKSNPTDKKISDLSSNSVQTKQETVRISSNKLDLLLRRGEQLVLARLNSKQRWNEAQNLLDNINLANRLLQEIADKSEGDPFLHHLSKDLRSIVNSMQRHTRSLGADYHELNNQLQSLLNEVKGARLAPVRPLLEELEIAARRIARQLSKKVRINIVGGDLELDRSIMESLKIPLIHLVRNALDHGLESTEERLAVHKNQEGHLSIEVISRGTGLMEFIISDDGRGIQTDEVIEAAQKQGIISDGSEADSLDLIFTSGVSTSSKVTELSGRGLGMAIVREKIENLKGAIRVKTKIGEGTSFILSIPTSLATFEGLLIKEQGRFLVFPLSGIEAVAQIKTEEIFTIEGCQMIRFRGRSLPITRLGQLLKLPVLHHDQPRTSCSTVIAAAGGRHLALIVDEIFGVQEVLSRDLGPQLKKVRFITGACMVGYHQVVPVLNVADLLTNIRGSIRSIPQPEVHVSPLILVTDDSITTRTLIRGLLEAAGFRVRVAADGSQAWELMQNEKFDMLISDVDMPGITGFDLAIKIRSNSRLSKTPIILITGQERIEDRQRGLKLGANAYIGKSSFDKGLLLEAVTRFLGEVKVSK
ncbi:MAG: response regulator [Candidatus Bruticola sp.]